MLQEQTRLPGRLGMVRDSGSGFLALLLDRVTGRKLLLTTPAPSCSISYHRMVSGALSGHVWSDWTRLRRRRHPLLSERSAMGC
jgi:hypothetical protein